MRISWTNSVGDSGINIGPLLLELLSVGLSLLFRLLSGLDDGLGSVVEFEDQFATGDGVGVLSDQGHVLTVGVAGVVAVTFLFDLDRLIHVFLHLGVVGRNGIRVDEGILSADLL